MIQRTALTQLLKDTLKFPVLGLLGPRQSGKTTLAHMVRAELTKPSIYIDLELLSDIIKLEDPEQFLKQYTDHMVVIDEVQRMPELFPLLRALVDSKREKCRFLLLGSASPSILKNASESLAGRIAYSELTPLNYTEIRNTYHFRFHWFWGGFPEALLDANPGNCRSWLDGFIRSYIEKDLPDLGLNISPTLLFRFWTMLAHLNGNLLNASALARSMGLSGQTISRYLDYMEGAFLIRRLEPFFINTKKRLVKSPKIYLRDTGLLHRLLRIENQTDLPAHIAVGASWESYVVEQVARSLPAGIQLYFYRTQVGAECDMVLCKAGKPVAAIEIKHSASPSASRGLLESIADLKTRNNFILMPEGVNYQQKNGVYVCDYDRFMTDILPSLCE